jgi:hypothetical protein
MQIFRNGFVSHFDWITHERTLCLVFNFAYEVVGQGLVSDAIYEYGIAKLKELKATKPDEWAACTFFADYFVGNDDWEYTGSGVPRTSEVEALYQAFIIRMQGLGVMAKETPQEEIQRVNDQNKRQMATIQKQAEKQTATDKEIRDLRNKVAELGIWEKFASHLANECVGQTVTEENLDTWVNAVMEQSA